MKLSFRAESCFWEDVNSRCKVLDIQSFVFLFVLFFRLAFQDVLPLNPSKKTKQKTPRPNKSLSVSSREEITFKKRKMRHTTKFRLFKPHQLP